MARYTSAQQRARMAQYVSVPEWLVIMQLRANVSVHSSVPERLATLMHTSVPEWLNVLVHVSVPEWLAMLASAQRARMASL